MPVVEFPNLQERGGGQIWGGNMDNMGAIIDELNGYIEKLKNNNITNRQRMEILLTINNIANESSVALQKLLIKENIDVIDNEN